MEPVRVREFSMQNLKACLPGNKKTAAAPTTVGIRWRLGWHGGFPLQPRGSVPPSFDGFTLGSVTCS
jgi:hypothetical protein